LVLAFLALALPGAAWAQVAVEPAAPGVVAAALAESPGPWADDAIEVVVGRGIYVGYPDGTFRWRQDITRAEMAVVLARLIAAAGLDALDPGAQAVLREAVVTLDRELAGALEELARLRERVDAAGGRLDALEAADAELARQVAGMGADVGELSDRVAALEEALATLRAAASAEELAALERELAAAQSGMNELSDRVAALESAPAGQPAATAAEAAELRAALADLRARQATADERVAALEASVEALAASQAPASGVNARLESLTGELAALEARLGEAEERLDDVEARLEELEDRVDEVADTVLPDRGGFYVSLAAFGSDPAAGLLARVAVGHDAVLGAIGFRLSYEHAFGPTASNAAGIVTYTTAFGASDAYLGVGAGVAFEADPVPFGEVVVGIQYRLMRHLALFVEGRYRPYFDGTNDQYGGVGGGVQLRF